MSRNLGDANCHGCTKIRWIQQIKMRIIDKWETDVKVNYEALGVSETWNEGKKIELIKEYNDVW